MIRAKVLVTLKKEVSDVQGQTIQQTVSKMDFPEVNQVRVGKYFEIELDPAGGSSDEQVRGKLDQLCGTVLSNEVIEDFSYEIEQV